MQPFQKASEALRAGADYPVDLGKKAALTAAGSAAGYLGLSSVRGVLPKVQAFLSNFLPENISEKGLRSVDPRMSSFITAAQQSGYTFDEIKNLISQKVGNDQPSQAQPQAAQAGTQKNPIEKIAPDLHAFMMQEIQKGRTPLQAGALAEMGVGNKSFGSAIQKLKKDLNLSWSQIVEDVYKSRTQPQAAPAPAAPQPSAPAQAAPQVGQGQQALMQMLQQINQKLSKQP